jgi:protein-S-isoprenylcysteine O-methyltransferase Ste14
MDAAWTWQIALVVVFFANFGLEALVGTTDLHKRGWARFYHTWIFGRLWSGPAYLLPLLSQPRFPTATGTWWAGVIGDADKVRPELAFAGIGWLDLLGWTLFAAAWALWIWAFLPRHPWAMQPPDEICRAGPYRYIRHPVNLGWLLFVLGWYPLWGGVYSLYLSPLMFAFFVLEAFWEERFLLGVGGNAASFARYRREVGMLMPRLDPAPETGLAGATART